MQDACPRSSLFREVNERIRELSSSWETDEPVGFFCECDDPSCLTPIELPSREYDAIRAQPGRLFTVPGHRTHGALLEQARDYALVAQAA